jgi:hypothetical protein
MRGGVLIGVGLLVLVTTSLVSPGSFTEPARLHGLWMFIVLLCAGEIALAIRR